MDSTVITAGTQIVYTILSVFPGYFLYRLLCSMLPKRNRTVWSLLVFSYCYFGVNMVIFPGDRFNVTINLVLFCAVSLVAFTGNVLPRLAAVAVFYPLIISLNFLIMDVLGRLWMSTGSTLLGDVFVTLLDAVLHILFWLWVWRFFQKNLSQIGKIFDTTSWLLLICVCLASLFSITTCIYFAPEESWQVWITALSCIVTNIASLHLARYFSSSIRQSVEAKSLKLQQQYYEELENNQQQIRKLRHDIRNHLAVLGQLLSENNVSGASSYLEELTEYTQITTRRFCEKDIVNAILNLKYQTAIQEGIDCFFHIDIDGMCGIDDISLCSIFANTLDNAIEACRQLPEDASRRLSAKARFAQNRYFSYEITNTRQNTIQKKNGRFLTGKSDKKMHGLGLSSVQEAVEKYGGTFHVSYTDTEFCVVILIGL